MIPRLIVEHIKARNWFAVGIFLIVVPGIRLAFQIAEWAVAAAMRIMATFAIFLHGEIRTADARAAALRQRLVEYAAR